MRERLCYSRSPRFRAFGPVSDTPQPHARLVWSQSFPHLWKKLWKFLRIHVSAQLVPLFLGPFRASERRNPHEIGVFRPRARPRPLEIVHQRTRKSAEARICSPK